MDSVKHFLQFKDFTRAEFDHLFERSRWIKGSSRPTANTGRSAIVRW
jgi:ornithine carbamoyltransferase